MAWSDEMTSLADAVSDEFGVACTFRRTTKGSWTAATGARAQTTADTTIHPVRSRGFVTLAGDGKRRIEETRWSIQAAELVGVTPGVNDLIIDAEGNEHAITQVGTSCDRTMWEVTTQRSVG